MEESPRKIFLLIGLKDLKSGIVLKSKIFTSKKRRKPSEYKQKQRLKEEGS